MAFVIDTDLASTAAGKGAALVGFARSGPSAVVRTALDKMHEFATFEDFGAVGDYDPATDLGTDDTAAIQAAINWAYAEGRAILMTARNFLCGPIITHPYTTIIGTGRQTSTFWCKTGTTGKWWTSNGNGAQKVMLSGIAWYGRCQPGVTHILELGNNPSASNPMMPEPPFGTEGLIDGLWLRDAPNATALQLVGNVGIVNNLTVQACATNLQVFGDANLLSGIVPMEASVLGADIHSSVVDRIEIEATKETGLPLRISGDTSVDGLFISTARGTRHSHLIEVTPVAPPLHTSWALNRICLLQEPAPATNGILKVGSDYYGGTSAASFAGSAYQRNLDLYSSFNIRSNDFAIKSQRIQAFSLQILNDGGTIKHRIGALADASLPGNFLGRVAGATGTPTPTPTGNDSSTAFAAGGKVSSTYPSMFVLDTVDQPTADQLVTAQVLVNQTGHPLTAWATILSLNVNGVTRSRLMVQVFDAASGTPYDLTSLPAGKVLVLGVTGYIA